MASTILVGADKLRATAMQLESLRDEAQGVLNNYLAASHNIAGGGWQGDASVANVTTTEEIHNAQMKLNTQWGELIQALKAAATRYEEQEAAGRAAVQGVSQA
jgi:WXG100 family type VII secretion target